MNQQDQMNANEEPTDESGGKEIGWSEIEIERLKMKRRKRMRTRTRTRTRPKRPKRPKRKRQRRGTTTHHQTKHDECHHESESADCSESPRNQEGDPEKTP